MKGKLYVKKFTQNLVTEIDGFEIPIRLPDMPDRKDMLNYGLPVEKQKFSRTVIPKDLEYWSKPKRDEFVGGEWHKRFNGVWMLIKGDPYYLPGTAYVFFNYWHTEKGPLPDFRMEALQYFWVNDMAELDRNCFGVLDIKCRRVGDTEKELFLGWEMVTRYKHSWFGMQNQSDTDAFANFQRAVYGAQRMVFYFAPQLFAGDTPQREMVWRFPQQQDKSGKRLDRRMELGSRMDFRPTKSRLYDGKRLRRYHLDEPGKISPTVMDCHETWSIVKLCLSLNNGRVIVGKAALTTTVEELGDGASVDVMQKLWDESNPKDLNENGRTTTGLWRVFRGYLLGAEVDEWGFHKTEEAKKDRDNEIRALQRKGKFDQIVAFKRKLPANIHEALATSGTDCILGAYQIDEQIRIIEEMLSAGRDWPTRPIKGSFVWGQGFGSEVVWVPNEHGDFEVSGHPKIKNARHIKSGAWAPSNDNVFGAGADPIDHIITNKTHKKIQHKGKEEGRGNGVGSDGALAIGCVFNPLEEEEQLIYDEHGNVENAEVMTTNRCVCTYSDRPFNPYLYYEECLKACIYYGCKINIETQKPGMISWFMEKGFGHYLANKPILSDPKAFRNRKPTLDIGSAATTGSINSYVGSIKRHNDQFIATHTHLPLLRDMRQFNGTPENRTKRDRTVAWGWALLLLDSIQFLVEKQTKVKKVKSLPFRLHDITDN